LLQKSLASHPLVLDNQEGFTHSLPQLMKGGKQGYFCYFCDTEYRKNNKNTPAFPWLSSYGGKFMRRWFLWLGLLLAGLLLVACGQATPSADLRQTPTPTPTQAKVVDYCVDCHTSKDTLIKNLKPAVVKPVESEGTG
jgi:hypothetical protein